MGKSRSNKKTTSRRVRASAADLRRQKEQEAAAERAAEEEIVEARLLEDKSDRQAEFADAPWEDDIPWEEDPNNPDTGSGTPPEKHPVKIIRDHGLEYPQLYIDVFIAGPDWERRAFAEMFARSGSQWAKDPNSADLVVFTGGDDVNPVYYGEKPHKTTKFSQERDDADIALYKHCYDHGIPMLGVCRGAQFLHVMNGGKLYQDVDNHTGDHPMWDISGKQMIERVSSVHHQMVIQNYDGGMKVLGTISNKSKRREKGPGHPPEVGSHMDIEAFWYPDTLCIGVQGHPEYRGYSFFTIWVLKQIDSLILLNPDTGWSDESRRRLNPDILALRDTPKPVLSVKEPK